jgi:hypothetical protein
MHVREKVIDEKYIFFIKMQVFWRKNGVLKGHEN